MARLTRLFVIYAVVLSFSVSSFAQQPEEESKSKFGPRRQLATIIFCGLGGAILGLSTLSFYGRPQDKLSNIAVGFAIGIIGGTVYVTYGAATKPKEFYGDLPGEKMNSAQSMIDAKTLSANTPVLGYTFNF